MLVISGRFWQGFLEVLKLLTLNKFPELFFLTREWTRERGQKWNEKMKNKTHSITAFHNLLTEFIKYTKNLKS